MKQVIFLFTLMIIYTTVIAQTKKHRVIAGTKYSLVPPAGFMAATNFAGFQHAGKGASIMLTEIPGPYATISEAMNESRLGTQGMTLLEKQTITFQKTKASLLKVSQTANGVVYIKHLLLFGDSKKTIMVNGMYPERNKEIEKEVNSALLSVSYNEKQSDDPLDAVAFKIDVSKTDFKFAKYISGNLIYSADGQIPTLKPYLTVAPSLMKIAAANQKQYAINRLKHYPRGEKITLEEIKPIEIGGMKGYEILAKGKNKEDKPELVYQVMLFTDADDYYLIVGMSTQDFDKRLKDFKAIARTFKRK